MFPCKVTQINTWLWVCYEVTLPYDAFPLCYILHNRCLSFFVLSLQAPCIRGLLPVRICSRRHLKISCPMLGVARVREVLNSRNLMFFLSCSHFSFLLGWHFQITKDSAGQASLPRHGVATLIFCGLCGCLKDIATGQLHLYKMSTVICSSLITESRKQGGGQDRDIFRSLLGKGQSVQKQFLSLEKQYGLIGEDHAVHLGLPVRSDCEVRRWQKCLCHHMHRTHRAALPLQKCLSALSGKFTSLSSCQSLADWFSMYTSAREAIVATMVVEWFKGCNALWRLLLHSTWTVVASAFPFIPRQCWTFGS